MEETVKSTWTMRGATDALTNAGYFKTVGKIELGRNPDVFENQLPSLRAYWLNSVAKFAKNEYTVYENERYTYESMNELVLKYVALLVRLGVKKGDHVALLSRNSPQWLAVFWAIHYLGAVSVAVNAWLPEDVLEYCVKKAKSVALFVDIERSIKLSSRLQDIANNGAKNIIVIGKQYHPNLSIPNNKHLQDGEVLLAKTAPSPGVEVHVTFTDPATIFFTSGTTSLPKAVLSTQRQVGHCPLSNTVSSIRALLRRGEPIPIPFTKEHLPLIEPKNALLTVPLFHVTGLQSILLTTTWIGGKVVLVYKWSVEDIVDIIIKEKIHVAGGVPFMASELVESRLTKLAQNPNSGVALEALSYGGAPPSLRLGEVIATKLPNVSPTQGWGLTETNATATAFSGSDYLTHRASCGFPTPSVLVKVIDPDTENFTSDTPHLGANKTGEIVVKGMQNAKEYFDDPKATSKAFTSDGWFRTGDGGYVDEEGFLYISDRLKDIIIRGGENIASVTVEAAISTDLRVREVAVLPVPDESLGELVSAVVVPWPGKSISEDDVKKVVAERMPKHTIPTLVIVRDTSDLLPRNANGKIVKKDIKDHLEVWARVNPSKPKL